MTNKTKWVGQPPKITREQYAELLRIEQARKALPTVSELAVMWGVSQRGLRNSLKRGIARYEGGKR